MHREMGRPIRVFACLLAFLSLFSGSAGAQIDWFQNTEKPPGYQMPAASAPRQRTRVKSRQDHILGNFSPKQWTSKPKQEAARHGKAAPAVLHTGRTVAAPSKEKRNETAHGKKGRARQETAKVSPEDLATPIAPVVPKPQHAPYESDLLRLAEILGTLSYLETLCGKQTENWNARMEALMDAEAVNEEERERLAGAYNHGIRDYQLSYRTCTPNARAVITRFFAEGAKISNSVIDRYGTY